MCVFDGTWRKIGECEPTLESRTVWATENERLASHSGESVIKKCVEKVVDVAPSLRDYHYLEDVIVLGVEIGTGKECWKQEGGGG